MTHYAHIWWDVKLHPRNWICARFIEYEKHPWKISEAEGVYCDCRNPFDRRRLAQRRHYDVIKWKNLPRHWPFVRGIHRSPMSSPLKGQWRGAVMLSLICVWINGWVNNGEAGDLRRYRAHYEVTAMQHPERFSDACREKRALLNSSLVISKANLWLFLLSAPKYLVEH